MSTIDHYLSTRYERYARGPDAFDCWGMARDGRVMLFGRPLLPTFDDVDPDDKQTLTREALAVRDAHGFQPVAARPGAIATAWRSRLCVHVGLVVEADGRLWVLETDEKSGPSLTRPGKFESRYTRVIYYDD